VVTLARRGPSRSWNTAVRGSVVSGPRRSHDTGIADELGSNESGLVGLMGLDRPSLIHFLHRRQAIRDGSFGSRADRCVKVLPHARQSVCQTP
jgi:hypothetical protein